MNVLLWLLCGLVVGWLTSNVMQTNRRLNMLVGVLGALSGGLVFNFVGFSSTTITDHPIMLETLGVSYGSAIILLTSFNHVQRSLTPRVAPSDQMDQATS